MAGTVFSKTIYLFVAFFAIGASLLFQFLVVEKQKGK
jgi:hypothetical protein